MSLGTIELMSKMMLKYQTPMVGLWHCLTFIGRLLPINICQGIYGKVLKTDNFIDEPIIFVLKYLNKNFIFPLKKSF